MRFARTSLRLILIAVLGIATFATDALAQQRLRGEVENVEGNVLTVKAHDGKVVKVTLDDGYTVSHAIPVTLSDLTPGTYVGVGAVPDGDGMKAAHVQIFPPTTGAKEGHGPWNADPAGTMTNAPVTTVVTADSGGMLTVTTNGQNYDIKVGPDTPIVKTVAGTKDLVKKGAWIGISNLANKDGVLSTRQVLVSDDRRYPAR